MRLFVVPVLLLMAVPVRGQDADKLEVALRNLAPELVRTLKTKGVHSVGVLKFFVDRGDGKAIDDAGVVNRNLADRLETALILGLNKDEKDGIVVLSETTDRAAENKLTTHLDSDGRREFFEYQYPPAWGAAEPLAPDYFLTGTATIAPDLSTIRIVVQGFDKSGKLENLTERTAIMDARLMAEGGFSYIVPKEKYDQLARGRSPADQNKQLVASTPKRTPSPMSNEPAFVNFDDAPIGVQVLYNNKPMPIIDGRVQEPTANTDIRFRVTNKLDQPVGFVLKVNGESTAYRERSEAFLCKKWLLKAKASMVIIGFQESLNKATPFRVLPPRQSRENEVNYGSHSGTFQVAVFVGDMTETEPTPPKAGDLEQSNVAAISRGVPKAGIRAGTLRSLQADLRGREGQNEGSRGLIVPAEVSVERKVQPWYFVSDADIPVAVMTIRYYQNAKTE